MPRFIGDPFFIPKEDPTRHYRWLSDDPRRLSLWLRSYGDVPGYELEPVDNCERLGLPESYKHSLSGRIVMGHNVLASIPKEEHERRVKELLDEGLERLAAAKEEVHAKAEGLPGVRSFEEHPDATADRKAYHTREDRPFSGQAGRGKSPHLKP